MGGALVVDVGSIADRMRGGAKGKGDEESSASDAALDDALDEMVDALSQEKVDKGALKAAFRDAVEACMQGYGGDEEKTGE